MNSHPPQPPSVWAPPGEDTSVPVIYVDRSGRAILAHPDEIRDMHEDPIDGARAIASAIPLSLSLWGALALVVFLTQQ